MARELTDKQQKFLDVLFDEAAGDVRRAKELAGYSDSVRVPEVIKGIKEEILERTQMYMAHNAPRAAMSLVSGMIDPTELLDRVGLAKTEKLQVETTNGLMILPAKEQEKEDD
jgi:hypothetical protein